MRRFSKNVILSYRGSIEGDEGMREEISVAIRGGHDAFFYALYISSPYR